MTTAKEFFKPYIDGLGRVDKKNVEILLIEFAKLHVREALKEVSEQESIGFESVYQVFDESEKQIILNSYPLNKIK